MCTILQILAQNTVSVEVQWTSINTIKVIDPSTSIKRHLLSIVFCFFGPVPKYSITYGQVP